MGMIVTGLVVGSKLAMEVRRIQRLCFCLSGLIVKGIVREMRERDECAKDPAAFIRMIAEFSLDDGRVFDQLSIKLGILGMLPCIPPEILHMAQVCQAILLWRHLRAIHSASSIEVGLERIRAIAPVEPQASLTIIGLGIKAVALHILQDIDDDSRSIGL